MAYQVNWEPARDDLRVLDREVAKRVIKKVASIVSEPVHFVERLEGYPLWKLRVGDYRVILDVRQSEAKLVVVLVEHRSKVYQELRRRLR